MGLRLAIDLDTNLGNTQEAYVRIESINVNRSSKKIYVGVTIWLSKSVYDLAKESNSYSMSGLLENKVVSYEDIINNPYGLDIEIPVFYEFDIIPGAEDNLYDYCYKQLTEKLKQVLNSNLIENE